MKKQTFNLHTHTMRCGHAEGLDEQYIHSAIDAGFKVLGFSEHVPMKEIRIPNCRMFYEQKDEYLSSMQSLKEQYKDQIEIKIGYEVEYFEDHLEYLLELRKECDYMILGQHLKYLIYEYDCYCSDEDVLIYAKQVEEALSKGLITYVAHPDYFMLGRNHFSKACIEASQRIAKASLLYDVPLEINLNGFRYGKRKYRFYQQPGLIEECYPYPFRSFWEIVSSYGCKVIYGYDAHSPLTLLERDREEKANEILKYIPLDIIDEISIK